MDHFPPLNNGLCESRLPLCDSTALELGRALLNGTDDSSNEIIAGAICQDPFLALWCVCQAGEYFIRLPLPSEISHWFLSHGAVHFLSDSESCSEPDCEVDQPIKTAVATAAVASRHVQDEQAQSHRSHLLGLLAEANILLKSFSIDGQVASPATDALLPRWLATALRAINSSEPMRDASPEAKVSEARLRIQTGIEKLEAEDRQAVNEVCRQALTRFHAALPVARGILPVLCRKLLRLQQLETEFQTTLQREKLASLKQLAYGASHEINNPLANISTRAQTLLRDEKDPERHRQLSTINGQAFRAHEMISDMMLFAHPPQLHPEPTDVEALLKRVIEESGPEAQSQGTELCVVVKGDLPLWSVDPIQLIVALKALVRNSIEALGSGGHVVASLRLGTGENGSTPPVLEISVTDDGPGIPAAASRHLFDPFYSGREAGRGLGFGLAKCWRIVELHEGEILVDSQPGMGAAFTIRLPG